MVSTFLEFCFVFIFLLQMLILWCLLTVGTNLEEMKKDIHRWYG